jgi:hypothetical protein
MNACEPNVLGDALKMLWEGSCFSRLVFPAGQGPVQTLIRAVRTLLDAHTR